MTTPQSIHVLNGEPTVTTAFQRQLAQAFQNIAERGLPRSWVEDIRERFEIDLSSDYGGIPIENPFGKASGQLSMTCNQVAEDIQSRLGFVVLKTVIAQDESGLQSMSPWSVRESKMTVEPITGRSGETGWTVSWKGRGWWQSFDDYLELVVESAKLARGTGIPIVPSVKYHLPTQETEKWRVEEYRFTTQRILEAWQRGTGVQTGMPLEKDFSPTLAGSEKARDQERILKWLREVPGLIRESVPTDSVRIGLKLMNTLYEDEFQRRMLHEVTTAETCADFFVYGNRLFDPDRIYEGHQGIAFGGPDLSDRNLKVMESMAEECRLPWSATGNITTGRMAMEYALCGASSFQMHTVFQLPTTEYSMKTGSRTSRALHDLVYHPSDGLLVWMKHIATICDIDQNPLRFRDLIGLRRQMAD